VLAGVNTPHLCKQTRNDRLPQNKVLQVCDKMEVLCIRSCRVDSGMCV